MPQVTIIIPCYNEEYRLPLNEYEEFLRQTSSRILFVDDGSKDGTVAVLENLRHQFPSQVTILKLPVNGGKAEAVRRGMLSLGTTEDSAIVGFMDADLSIPLQESNYFTDVFENSNIRFVFGSRVCRIGARITRLHFYRFLFGRILATSISLYLKIPVYDTQCGIKFFQAGLAKQLFAQPFVSRWLFDVELFRRMALMNISVEECAFELPLRICIEKKGSKIRIKDCLKLPFDFLTIVRHYNANAFTKYLSNIDKKPLTQVKVIIEKEAREPASLH